MTTTQTSTKGRTLPPEVLTTVEVKALINACSRRAPTGIRNRALIAVLFTTGLRISEALALKPKDIDSNAGTITVLQGKGRRRRVVGVPLETITMLEHWLEVRRARGINGHQPVFCTLAGKPITGAYIRGALPRMAAKAGIEKRVHAHGLRHSHAANLAAHGAQVLQISAALGHGSVATTDRYIRHLNNADAVAIVKDRSWGLA